jgi:ribose transport system substrate-binding protein
MEEKQTVNTFPRRSRTGDARAMWKPFRMWVPILVLCAGLLGACGSSNKGSSSSSSTGSAGTATTTASTSSKDKATAFLASLTGSAIKVNQPIAGKIPSGVTVNWISCGYDTCATLGKNAIDAGKVLGWNVKYINGGLSPAEWQQGATTIVRNKPDYAVIAGIDAASLRPQIKQMNDAGIKVLGFATSPVGGLVGMVRPPRWNINYGKAAAAYIIAHSPDANPTIGFAVTTEFAAGRQNQQGVKEARAEFCPNCPYEELEVPATSVGKDAAQRILNWLRGKPNVKYVILSTDGMALGLPAALKSAGIADRVKLVTLFPSAISIPLLKSGQMDAALATNDGASSWDTIDAVARLAAGDSAAQPTAADSVPLALLTAANVGTALPDGPGAWRQDFQHLWGK